MWRSQNRRRLLLGLAISLLAHALLLLGPRRPPLSPVQPPVDVVELELVFEDAQVPDAAIEEGESQASRVTHSGPVGDLPPAITPGPRVPASSAAAPRQQEPTPEQGEVVRQEEDGVWREEALPKLDLVYRPKVDPGGTLEGIPEGSTDGDLEGDATSEARQIEERLEGFFRDKRAEERARFRAEPALVELRQRFERQFSVPMEVLDEAPQSPNLGLGGAAQAYLSQAQRYGETGNPYEEDGFAPGAPDALDTVASTVFRYGRADATFGPPVSSTTATLTTLVVRIEVVRLDEGIEVRLLEGSGVPRFDRLALEQARREVERMSFPARVQRTRWAFISSLRVTPPSPVVGCSLDQAFIPQECFYPGSKHQRSRVLLEAVYAE